MRTVVSIEYQKLIDVTEKICDGYCKWPTETESQEQLNRFCDECPLNTILCEDRKQDSEDSDCPWQE